MRLENLLGNNASAVLLPIVASLIIGPLDILIDALTDTVANFRAVAGTTSQQVDDRTVDILDDVLSLLRSLRARAEELEVG